MFIMAVGTPAFIAGLWIGAKIDQQQREERFKATFGRFDLWHLKSECQPMPDASPSAAETGRDSHCTQHEWVLPTSNNGLYRRECGRCGEPYNLRRST